MPTMKQPMTFERKNGKDVPNPKRVKVVLTVAHLDNDETNWDVKDELQTVLDSYK